MQAEKTGAKWNTITSEETIGRNKNSQFLLLLVGTGISAFLNNKVCLMSELVVIEKPESISFEDIHELLFLAHKRNQEQGNSTG